MKLQILLFVLFVSYVISLPSHNHHNKKGHHKNDDNLMQTRDIIVVPDRCPEGQHLSPEGECVVTWGRKVV